MSLLKDFFVSYKSLHICTPVVSQQVVWLGDLGFWSFYQQ